VGRPLITLMVLIALIVVVLLFVNSFGGRGEAIAAVRAEGAQFERQRDSLITLVNARDRQQSALLIQRESLEAQATHLRASLVHLEQQRVDQRLTVRTIRTTGQLQARLRTAFPEFARAPVGLTTLPLDDGDTLGLEYLLVPAWFAETFIIDHQNAASWRAQKDRLLAVDSLRLAVSALQDSVLVLEAANAAAYRSGYDAATAGYRDLSARYIAELEKPRFSLRSALGLLGAAGVGVMIGRAVP